MDSRFILYLSDSKLRRWMTEKSGLPSTMHTNSPSRMHLAEACRWMPESSGALGSIRILRLFRSSVPASGSRKATQRSPSHLTS